MKKRISLILVIFIFLQSISLVSCNEKLNKYSAYSFDYFDTVTTVTGYEKSKEEFDSVSSEILSELEKYHRNFNIYTRYEGLNNLCTINELSDGRHRTVEVDRSIINMLLFAKDMYYKTNGKVNVASGSVLSIWHDFRKEGKAIPPIDKLKEAAEHMNIEDMLIDAENCTVTLLDPKMKLDVGAIAKGYAVEMVAKKLEEEGKDGYVINVGGNVRTIGKRGDGKNWLVGIENPENNENDPYYAYLELSGDSLVTSGSYQRYYTVDGKRYHHIIDLETLYPGDDYLSVSIICQSSALGDALSTALFCMTLEEGLEMIESIPDAEVMWVTLEGEKITSSGFEKYTTER